MRTLWRWVRRLLLLLLGLVAGYIVYASWAWRDIPVATLEQQYGDATLQTAPIDGVPIRYRLHRARDTRAPVLVLIHSHFFEMGMWNTWVEQLADDFTLLRYDLSGHGLTGPDPSDVYTVQRDVALLDGLLAYLQISKAVLVGSSLGGNIAFHYAAAHPERISALTLINSGGLKRNKASRQGSIPSWADHVLPLLPPALLHRFVRWMVADDDKLDAATLRRFVHMWRRAGNRQAELNRLRQFHRGSADKTLAAVQAPSLILWGAANPQLPADHVERFRQALVNAERVESRIYPGVGHVIPLEAGIRSAADTAHFVRSLIPPTPRQEATPE